MVERLLRWRTASVIVGGALFVATFFAVGLGHAVIQVDFQRTPEIEGATVLIDGDSAGVLFRRGSRRLSGFKVGLGPHTVEIRHEKYGSEPAEVDAALRGVQYVLYADFESRRAGDAYHSVLVLKP